MSSTANDLTQVAKNLFLDSNRDLLALTKNGANDVFKRIAAALALDSEAQSDCLLYADILDQKAGYAREIVAGERAPRQVAPPPPPPKSAAELLTEEVLLDWKHLPADKVKLKMNNRAYKAEFDRLMAADQLDSQIASLHDTARSFGYEYCAGL